MNDRGTLTDEGMAVRGKCGKIIWKKGKKFELNLKPSNPFEEMEMTLVKNIG
jgi:hypothetical protein